MRFEKRIKRRLDDFGLGGWEMPYDGGQVSEGYKPDRVYRRYRRLIIVEIEASTSRKGFLGGYLKAQKYMEEKNATANSFLLYLMNGKRTSVSSIENQISQYHEWFKDHNLPVRPVYLVDTFEFEAMKPNMHKSLDVLLQRSSTRVC